MLRDSVVAVTGSGGPGSGYLLGPGLVLTSAHVVGAPAAPVSLFQPGSSETSTGRVVWCGTEEDRDAALVLVDDLGWPADQPSDGLVRWGRPVTHRPGIRCRCWGVPDIVQRKDRPIELAQPEGTLNPGDRMVGDRYLIRLDGPPPESSARGRSPWGGMSGAAVFAADRLVGVVASDPAGWRHGVLEAVPAHRLYRDPAFRMTLEEHGPAPVAFDGIELAGLADDDVAGSRADVITPAGLLHAHHAVVPFHGRDDLLARLATWADEAGTGVWLAHGQGGQGKTRLAHEFAVRLRDRDRVVLWLGERAPGAALEVIADVVEPVLVVVDQAESRVQQVADLLRALSRRHAAPAVRILLLARTAGSWWEQLGDAGESARALIARASITELPPLDTTLAGRRETYRSAVVSFATALAGMNTGRAIDWAGVGAELARTGHYDSEAMDSVLALHMTALTDLLDAPRSLEDTGDLGQAPEDRLLGHESFYWRTTAVARGLLPAMSQTTLDNVIAAAVLLGPPSVPDVDALLDRVPGLADQSQDRRQQVVEWLAGLYPSSDGRRAFDSVRPDRLAEWLVGRILRDPNRAAVVASFAGEASDDEGARLVAVCARAAAHPAHGAGVGEFLTRLCVEHAGALAVPALRAATQVAAPQPLLTALDDIVTDPATSIGVLEQLVRELPDQSRILARYAALLIERLLERYDEMPVDDPLARDASLADLLNNLSIRLGPLGRETDAFITITAATSAYIELAKVRPEAYLPGLAACLNNFANRLSELDRQEEALEAIGNAVHMYHGLVQGRPNTHLPHLATSLGNLATILGELHRREAALGSANKAISIRRGLVDRLSGAYLPELARGLRNLAILLRDADRHPEALDAIDEAVAILRELADARPDAHLSDLARSLAVRTHALTALGRAAEALACAEEVVMTCERLAQSRPDEHQPLLANQLLIAAGLFAEAGQQDKAMAAATRAVRVRREIPGSEKDLADALHCLAVLQADLGSGAAAIESATEAAAIHRAEAEPRTTALANVLNNLSLWLGVEERWPEAIAAARDAVDLHRAGDPATTSEALATSLTNLAVAYGIQRDWTLALSAIDEAIRLRHALTEDDPERHRASLDQSLTVLSWVTDSAGYDEPIPLPREARPNG